VSRKICVVVSARASYARFRTALAAVRDHPDLQLQLVVTASALLERYGRADRVMEAEGFHIDRRVHMVFEGGSPVTSAKSTGLGLSELATVFEAPRPDAAVTIADRFETMATAVAAAYLNIPLVHIQGGEVTGSIDEKVRHAVTKLADLHFVSSPMAAARVERLGEQRERIYMTGCPSIDVAKQVSEAAPFDVSELYRRFGGVGQQPDLSGGFVVVLQHPVTTEFQESRAHIAETLAAVYECALPALWFWPNVDAGSDGTSNELRAFRERTPEAPLHFFKNFPPEDFLGLLCASRCIVGNSSVAIRECAYLGVPAVNIGGRQAGRDRGANVQDVDYVAAEILQAIQRQCAHGAYKSDALYGNGASGRKVASLLSEAPLVFEKRLTY